MSITEKIQKYGEENIKHNNGDYINYELIQDHNIICVVYTLMEKPTNPMFIIRNKERYIAAFDINGNNIIKIMHRSINRSSTAFIKILDETNIILPSTYVDSYEHYQKQKETWKEVKYLQSQNHIPEMIDDNTLILNNCLYKFKSQKLIDTHFDRLSPTNCIYNHNMLSYWNINNQDLETNILEKLKKQNLICGYKKISYENHNTSYTLHTFAFLDKNGNIVSDLFYREQNKIISIPVNNNSIDKTFNQLHSYCETKVNEQYEDISNEIIKKMI